MTKVVRRGLHTYGYILIIATIITVFAALTTMGVSAVEFDTAPYKNGVTITGFNGLNDGEKVVIPAKIDGKVVLAIGLEGGEPWRIPNADKIGALDISDAGVKVILPYAFYGCSNIKGATRYVPDGHGYGVNATEPMLVSDTVEEIGDAAFFGCAALKTFDAMNCQTIGNNAFFDCTGITELYANKCTEIGSNAFANCTNLNRIKLQKCAKIGDFAFVNCRALQYISLSNVYKPSDYAFYGVPDTCFVNGVPIKTFLASRGINY